MLDNGVILVRFDSETRKNEVLQGGIYHFDNKPFIVKAWSPDMKFTREEPYTVPIWIKLPGVDFKYWSLKGFSKIGSLVGKPLMVDRNTEKKIGLNFARLLVEVVLDAQLPETILFRNEKGNLIEQKLKSRMIRDPLCANSVKKYGDLGDDCIKKKGPKTIPNKIPKEHEEVVLPNMQTDAKLTQANNTIQNSSKSAPAQPQTSVQSRQSPTCISIQDIQKQPQEISVWVTPSKTRDSMPQISKRRLKSFAMRKKDERRLLWDSFENHSLRNAKPWLALGDFNSFLKSEDRLDGNPVTWAEVIEFQTCIDRYGLSEMAYQDTIPACKANYLPEGISDHCSIKVIFVEERLNTNKSFQFCNVWAKHHLFIDKVQTVWGEIINGGKMFQVVKKLKLLKKEFKVLNTQFFRNVVAGANDDINALYLAQNKLQADPMNMIFQQEEMEKFLKLKNTSSMAEMFLQQRSKANWINLGDDNTNYFHYVIKHRRLKQATTQLKDENGVWQHDPAIITILFVKYYEEMLGNVELISRVMEALGHFSAATGLIANMDKSNLFIAGVDDTTKSKLLLRTGFALGTFPIKYLGLHLSSKKWNKLECHQLILKITNRIKTGYVVQLSYAENTCGAQLLTEKDTIYCPKNVGGLNIKGCRNWNIASVGKLLWQLSEKEDFLWVR
ncbi:hypothetical protein KY290_037099 [Solanum tuberosum]|uniref:DUF4283 domain-containing protein n=1 Tax=Solanum tuberosum TaxID=4113 RepID=A0ABQ7TWG3_SOLTU|nr:hypothetical protein KY290_037099 [Solanum tuberosum]